MSQLDGTPVVIGFDTSNYRTSVAAVTLDGEILVNHRELLPVSSGERGLRQSDAVFAHIRQLRNSEEALREKLKGTRIAAVAASTKPRDGEESYMPVFQVGHTAGSMMAAALGFRFMRRPTSGATWLRRWPERSWKAVRSCWRCICPAGQRTCW